MKRRSFLAWVAGLPFVGPIFFFLKEASAKELDSRQCLDFSLRRMRYHLARNFPDISSNVKIGEPESYVRIEVEEKKDLIREKFWLSFESILFNLKQSKTIKAEIDASMKRISNLLGLLVESYGDKSLDVRLTSFERKFYNQNARAIELEIPPVQATYDKFSEEVNCLILNWSVCTNGWSLCEKRDLRESDEYVGFISMDTPRFVMP